MIDGPPGGFDGADPRPNLPFQEGGVRLWFSRLPTTLPFASSSGLLAGGPFDCAEGVGEPLPGAAGPQRLLLAFVRRPA